MVYQNDNIFSAMHQALSFLLWDPRGPAGNFWGQGRGASVAGGPWINLFFPSVFSLDPPPPPRFLPRVHSGQSPVIPSPDTFLWSFFPKKAVALAAQYMTD
jgi:hypothetical protein